MYGINEQQFDSRIRSITSYCDEVSYGVKKIKSASEEIAGIFRDNGIGNIASRVEIINNNNEKIYQQVTSYADTLTKVKKSYQNQAEAISTSIKNSSIDL